MKVFKICTNNVKIFIMPCIKNKISTAGCLKIYKKKDVLEFNLKIINL